MYPRDPIVSSSPPQQQAPRRRQASTLSASPPEQLADPFASTQPTLPWNGPARSAHVALPTQPTQILNSPYRPRNHVQVLRSSPAVDRFSSPPRSQYSQPQPQHSQYPPRPQQSNARPMGLMAPPGTYARPPQSIPKPVVDLTSDDPPVEPDSEEDDIRGSNIRPSNFEMQSTSRVEETPQKPSFGTSFASVYSYNGNGYQKRPANDELTPPRKKLKQTGPARAMPAQTGPARAIPAHTDLDPQDIDDFGVQKNVRRLKTLFPSQRFQYMYDTLMKNRGNYDATIAEVQRVTEEEPDAEFFYSSPQKAPEPAFVPQKTTERRLKQPIGTIQDRFGKVRRPPLSQAPAPSLSQPTASPATTPQKPKKKRIVRGNERTVNKGKPETINISSDEDEGIKLDSDSDSDADVGDEEELDDEKLLEFFNTCTPSGMADLSGLKEEDIKEVLDQRPFKSLSEIEGLHTKLGETKGGKKARKPRITFGTRLVEAASNMWTGFGAVDQLVKQCKERGKPIADTMATWGVNVFGGEVAITSLDNNDSGVGTPSPCEDGDAKPIARSSAKKPLLKKPSNMSDEIELKDYQLVGLNWLSLLWNNGVSGILADDMGLGKTCQVISFICHLREMKVPGPHLIVVPGSTLENWLREFHFFAPALKQLIEPYYGGQAERYAQQDSILDNIDDIYVIVTTYDLAYKKPDNSFLRKCKPKACIFDEGHVLRNSDTQRYKSLMRIPATFRLLLTGTPLQNSLKELASILAFIMPDIFEEVQDKLEVVFKHKAKVNEADTHDALLSEQRIERARSMMTPFILRRKKAQVLKHMPKKTCRVEYCDLTETQAQLYAAQLEQQKQVLLDRAEGKVSKDHANVMMKLRQAAIHPLLFRHHYNDAIIRKMSKAAIREDQFSESDPDVIFEELKLYQDYQCHQLSLKYPRALGRYALKGNEIMDSGKIAKLIELVKQYKANGDRVLVFSQFTSVMDILQWVLDAEDVSYSRLDGSTPIPERQALLDQFYDDESITVFMLSTKSGGAGINLACANKVIIFDSSFNPQDDIQAENRAHRVGQTRDVEVVRLVTKGTVEEQIHALGNSKLELDKMVAGEECEAAGAKGKKGEKDAAKGEGISKADEMGIEEVERMMLEDLRRKEGKWKGGKEKEEERENDVKGEFLDGLKQAGLDMSAA